LLHFLAGIVSGTSMHVKGRGQRVLTKLMMLLHHKLSHSKQQSSCCCFILLGWQE
jgi:hypothetical protein